MEGVKRLVLRRMKQFRLTERDFNRIVSDVHVEVLSRTCCEQWKSLPPHLGLDTIVAKNIDTDSKLRSYKSKKMAFFRKWKEVKGHNATYKQLITALLRIDCGSDADTVCALLKGPLIPPTVTPQPLPVPLSGADDPSTLLTTTISDLDSDSLCDLHRQLDQGLDRIIKRYSCYVSCIRESLRDGGISPSVIASDLLTISAVSNACHSCVLLSAHRGELEGVTDFYAVFNLLVTEYASFMNYDLYEYMLDQYPIRSGKEVLKYPEYIDVYLKKIKIAEFSMVNPIPRRIPDTTREFIIQVDIPASARLAAIVVDLKEAIGMILGINPTAFQFIDVITEGCVLVTFLLPAPVAQIIFNKHTALTEEQIERLRAAGVLWFKCNGFISHPCDEAALHGVLKSIACEIVDPKEVQNLRFLGLGDADRSGAESAFEVFQLMQKKGKFSFTNVEPLKKVLENVGRCDLVSRYLEGWDKQTAEEDGEGVQEEMFGTQSSDCSPLGACTGAGSPGKVQQ